LGEGESESEYDDEDEMEEKVYAALFDSDNLKGKRNSVSTFSEYQNSSL